MKNSNDPYLTFFLPQAVALMDRARCSRDEKRSLLPHISDMLDLIDKSRKEGLLALDEVRADISDPLLQTGVGGVVDGWDLELVVELLVLHLVSQEHTGLDVLRGLMTVRGVTALAQGLNPQNTVKPLLLGFLGPDADLWERYQSTAEEVEPPPPSREPLVVLVSQVLTQPGRETRDDLLAEWAGSLDDVEVQQLLRETDLSTLVSALWNTDLDTLNKFSGNLSVRAATEVLQEVVRLGPEGRNLWREAQATLRTTFERLVREKAQR